jgi:hypothetical protein
MRQQSGALATLALITDSCFLSPERGRHDHCRQEALDLLEMNGGTDNEICAAILSNPEFAMQFYCQGAATACGNCGSLVLPGNLSCPECEEAFELTGALAIPEWQLRLVGKTLEIAVNTTEIANELLTYTINRTVRVIVLRNLLGQVQAMPLHLKAKEIREYILSLWPEGKMPAKDSWEFRFIRISAAFWTVAWPMLKTVFTLEEVDEWSTAMIRAVANSATKWADAEANPNDYAQTVRAIMDAEGFNKTAAINGLVPTDMQEQEYKQPDPLILHPATLIPRGWIITIGDSAFLTIPVTPDEREALETTYHNEAMGLDEFLSAYEGDE